MFLLNMTLMVILLILLLDSCHCGNASEYRLPDTHIPKNYILRLIIDPNSKEFSGEVEITFSTKSDTNSIHLHASPKYLAINQVTLNAETTCAVVNVDNQTEIAHITCPKLIEKSEFNDILIKFKGVYSSLYMRSGLYQEAYIYENKPEKLVASQFESIHARKAFPCFDEPHLKAEFDIMLIHPLEYNALTNSPVTYRTIEEPFMFTKFKKTPPMSTYLLAFVVSKYSRKYSYPSEENPDAFPLSVRFRPDQENRTGTALRYGGNLIHAHSVFTGVPYDELGDSKMDFVALPQFGGAMENWGLIVFDEKALLDDGNKTTPEHEQYIIVVMAHELAHQWFGDYVTLNWWSDVWLNEGFAAFFEMHFDEQLVGTKLDLERQFVPTVLRNALQTDEVSRSPLSSKDNEVLTIDDIDKKFDGISYDKGASIIRMMRGILGKENFQMGLQKYIKENGQKTATSKLLLDSLGSVYNNSNYKFEELLHNWVYERGHPIVSVSLNADGKTVQIKQEVNSEKSQWYIPISYTTSKENNFALRVDDWLFDKPLNVPVAENSWIVLNLQQLGFYRVKYDANLWNRIIDALKSDEMEKIHVSNRAQLLDDAFVLAGTNITLALAEYLRHETEYEPWVVIINRMIELIETIKRKGEKEAAAELKNRTLGWINEAFPSNKVLNLTTHLQKLTHNLIGQLKAYLEDKEILSEALTMYRDYISDKNIEDYNKRKIALCYGFKLSATPEADFDVLLRHYQESESSYERKEILSSLGCASDSRMLKMYLEEVLSEKTRISKLDIKNVFEAFYINYESDIDVFLTFFYENLEELHNKYGDIVQRDDIIWEAAKNVVTKEQFLKVEKLIMKYNKVTNNVNIKPESLELLSNQLSRKIQNVEDIKAYFSL